MCIKKCILAPKTILTPKSRWYVLKDRLGLEAQVSGGIMRLKPFIARNLHNYSNYHVKNKVS